MLQHRVWHLKWLPDTKNDCQTLVHLLYATREYCWAGPWEYAFTIYLFFKADENEFCHSFSGSLSDIRIFREMKHATDFVQSPFWQSLTNILTVWYMSHPSAFGKVTGFSGSIQVVAYLLSMMCYVQFSALIPSRAEKEKWLNALWLIREETPERRVEFLDKNWE